MCATDWTQTKLTLYCACAASPHTLLKFTDKIKTISDKNKHFLKALFTNGECSQRLYKGAADDSPPISLFAEAMSARFSAQQVVDLTFSDVQEGQENNDLEEEEVSEEEDREEYNPEHDASSLDEEIPQAERDIFVKEQQNNMVLVTIWQPGKNGSTTCCMDV